MPWCRCKERTASGMPIASLDAIQLVLFLGICSIEFLTKKGLDFHSL